MPLAMRLVRRSASRCGVALVISLGLASSALTHDSLTDLGGTVDRGAINAAFGIRSQPWIHKYFAAAGTCLHLQVLQVSPANDLEIVVVGPSPRDRWRDDDSGASGTCFNCPRVEIDPVPVTGYYTTIINHFAGNPIETDFLLDMQRRASGIGSCPNPTTPLPSVRTRNK
jgi:hypothetical protein